MKYNKRKYNLIFVVITMLFLAISIFLISFPSLSDNNVRNLESNFSIKKYDVILDVHENGIIDVSETINVHFNSKENSFIKRIPENSVYMDANGHLYSKKAIISNLKIDGGEYNVTSDGKNINIQFKNEKKVDELKKYTIAYTYDLEQTTNNDFDEFIFHAFDGYVDSKISRAQVTINMPKSLEDKNINFFTDKYRKESALSYVNYKIDGNSLIVKYNDNKKPLYSSLTIDLILPKGYFAMENSYFSWISLACIVASIVLSIINIIKKIDKKSGNDKIGLSDNLDPTELGYVNNNFKLNKKIFASLLFQLSYKGYLKIEEYKKDKKVKVKVTNLISMPIKPIEPTLILPVHKIEVKKLRDIDNDLTNQEKEIMKKLFSESYIGVVDKDIDKFMEVRDGLLSRKYIEIIDDNKKEVDKLTAEKKKIYQQELLKYQNELEKYENNLEKYNKRINGLVKKTDLEEYFYKTLFKEKRVIVLNDYKKFNILYSMLEEKLSSIQMSRINDNSKINSVMKSSILNYLSIILWLVAYFIFDDIGIKLYFLYYISLALIIFSLFKIVISDKKIQYVEYLKKQIKLFKNKYIDNDNNIEAKDFYKYLVIAYVLNCEHKFLEKMNGISEKQKSSISSLIYGSIENSMKLNQNK